MAERAERALSAIVRYEIAAATASKITKEIRDAINGCPIFMEAIESENPGQDTMTLWDGNRVKSHLYHCYRETTGSEGDVYSERYLSRDEQQEYLSSVETGCPECLRAWRLILERKDARIEFGIAKRAIRTIGKAAIKAAEGGGHG